jgi:hypothetical protein
MTKGKENLKLSYKSIRSLGEYSFLMMYTEDEASTIFSNLSWFFFFYSSSTNESLSFDFDLPRLD